MLSLLIDNYFYLCSMKEFSLHINSLIQKHDCVIIPDFGGFVLHRDEAKIAADGSIVPPQVSVGFNPELKYNDGLLAESYMNAYSISYDIACKKIGDVVYRLNTILGLRQPATVGNLGTLILDEEKRLSFIPNSEFSMYHPETFGLDKLDIKKLTDIEVSRKIQVVAERKNFYQRVFVSVGAAAAAVVIFFLTSTPITEPEERTKQKSGFFTDILLPSQTVRKIADSITVNSYASLQDSSSIAELAENTITQADLDNGSKEPNKEASQTLAEDANPAVPKKNVADKEKDKGSKQSDVKTVEKVSSPLYYVIIGSAKSKKEAQQLLVQFKSQGYRTAAVLNSKERPRIYVSVFESRTQAERFAADFRRANPRMNDAWVYTKRN